MAALPSVEKVRVDFDRIARLERPGEDHSSLYHEFLLRQVPAGCREALEIGCGGGAFARELASHSAHVTGIDLSPVMVQVARARCAGQANVEIIEADVLGWPLPVERYEFIASIATLHHLPAPQVLGSLARALKPGGVLAVIDVRSSRGGVFDLGLAAFAYPISILLRTARTGRPWPREDLRRAYEEHGRGETYLTFAQARALAAACLPGSVVRRHLLWRYSIVWRKRP